MSMTQEEIEALMNDTGSDDLTDSNDIDEMLNEIDGIVAEDESEDDSINIDSMLEDVVNDTAAEESIDGIIDNEESKNENLVEENDALEEIQEVESEASEIEKIIEPEIPIANEQASKEDIGKQIDEGVYPLPSSDEHKVVNQLNEVAEDTEEKASLIFDALTFQLDENEKINENLNTTNEFIDSQIELLTQLGNKFPNIQVLKENLQKANIIKETNAKSIAIVEEENMKIFEAMELMQYHDINRQKIERVMSVIKKLANYLNGIFVDDSNKSEVQIAKHISGDSTSSLDDDDLDNLISEFNK
jgi:hypothetical protein